MMSPAGIIIVIIVVVVAVVIIITIVSHRVLHDDPMT